MSKSKPFIVQNPVTGLYLVETPHWNAGKWTEDINLATVDKHPEDRTFFAMHYPAWVLIDATNAQLQAYEARKTQEFEERENKRVMRCLLMDKEDFHRFIRVCLNELGLDETVIAEACECHPSTVRRWASGVACPLRRTRVLFRDLILKELE